MMSNSHLTSLSRRSLILEGAVDRLGSVVDGVVTAALPFTTPVSCESLRTPVGFCPV
ncbi:unnamed protein product [Ixodes pacificus]